MVGSRKLLNLILLPVYEPRPLNVVDFQGQHDSYIGHDPSCMTWMQQTVQSVLAPAQTLQLDSRPNYSLTSSEFSTKHKVDHKPYQSFLDVEGWKSGPANASAFSTFICRWTKHQKKHFNYFFAICHVEGVQFNVQTNSEWSFACCCCITPSTFPEWFRGVWVLARWHQNKHLNLVQASEMTQYFLLGCCYWTEVPCSITLSTIHDIKTWSHESDVACKKPSSPIAFPNIWTQIHTEASPPSMGTLLLLVYNDLYDCRSDGGVTEIHKMSTKKLLLQILVFDHFALNRTYNYLQYTKWKA